MKNAFGQNQLIRAEDLYSSAPAAGSVPGRGRQTVDRVTHRKIRRVSKKEKEAALSAWKKAQNKP